MGLYITQAAVKIRLAGKVRFTDNPDEEGEENKMPTTLLARLISEAEGQVESDLSARYLAPFQTTDGQAFNKLPDRPTKEVLRTLCELKSVMRVLETDFGSGSATDASKYMEKLEKRYTSVLESLLEIKKDSFNIFVKPPLPGLRLNFHNEEADSGFRGRVLSSGSENDYDYPTDRINNPAQTFWNPGSQDMQEEPSR